MLKGVFSMLEDIYNSELRQGRQGNKQYMNQYISAASNDKTFNQLPTETFATNVQRRTRSGFHNQNPCVSLK